MKTLVKVILIMIFITSLSSDPVKILNPIIADFQVNENGVLSGANQGNASISADSSGNFIIAWQDGRNGHNDIYAQRYASDGTALGNNFQVNDDQGLKGRYEPSISSDVSGNFIITWRDGRDCNWDILRDGRDKVNWDIYAQRYASDGTTLGSNFQVNDDQGSEGQYEPSISSDVSGNFIIAWWDTRSGNNDIYAQRYSSDGTPLGSNFKVNDDTGSYGDYEPSISADVSGNFIITWRDGRNANDDIYAQRYASDGTTLGSNFQVNDDQGTEQQRRPSLFADVSGNFIIAWEDERNIYNDNYDIDIYAQRYSSDGIALGNNFKVNEDQRIYLQWEPSISADVSGNFIITWRDGRNYHNDIYAQRYSSDGIALGSNFKVNDDQGSESKFGPSISADVSGNFIITWRYDHNGNSDIYAQRYSSNVTPLGSNFQVNDDQGSEGQNCPSISADGSGNFIITWRDERNVDGDIYGQRYSKDGTAMGSNFKVNDDQGSYWPDRQYFSSISADSSGIFIITWEDYRNNNYDIYAQRYSSDGTPLGSNFQVNDDQGNEGQKYPSISTDGSGNFIITWRDHRNGNSDIYAQRYLSDGTALGSNFQVNDDQGSNGQYYPSISADGSGNFIITWRDYRNGNADIYAQRYSSNGIPLGSNFQVNDDMNSEGQYNPSISADGSGIFIITWEDYRNNNYDIYAQRYASDGTPLGSNFQINDDQGSTWQHFSSISADESGNFIIVWIDERNDDDDIYAQRYKSDGTALGSNFRVTNISDGSQKYPKVELWKNRIYSTWEDNRAGGTGNDIWANVLNWEDPVGASVDEISQIPLTFVLNQNYPNPFNPSTTIDFTLPKSEFVTLKIYNILGEEVATLVNDKLQAGNHTYQFDGSNLTSGIYLYRIEGGKYSQVRKMILIK